MYWLWLLLLLKLLLQLVVDNLNILLDGRVHTAIVKGRFVRARTMTEIAIVGFLHLLIQSFKRGRLV